MSLELFEKIMNQANRFAKRINFSFFGEPMMHPEFEKILDSLKNRDPSLRVVMNTNLSLATKKIYEKLINIKLDEFRLSIDAATSNTYEIIRPGTHGLDLNGNPNKKERFEMIFNKARYWFSMANHRPTRHVFTVNSRNKHELKTFAEQWMPLLGKEDKILFKNIVSYGGKISDEMIRHNPCNVWDLHSLTIDWQGNVSPCNLDTNMDLKIGSILDMTLSELLQTQKIQELEHLSKEKKIFLCQKCIDANNWSRNIVLNQSDTIDLNTIQTVYGMPLEQISKRKINEI